MPNTAPSLLPRDPRDWKRYDNRRPNSTQRGYDAKWRAARIEFLRTHPLCAECERHGRLTPASVVDHIIPHRGDYAKFWDESNWQPMCDRCHNAKTGRGD